MRQTTQNLAVGYQTVRWHDSMFQIRELFPDAFEVDDALIVPRFSRFDAHVSLSARLTFRAGSLEGIELYPSIEHAIEDWGTRKQHLVHEFQSLAEANEAAEVSVEEDWSDVKVSIRRRPLSRG